MGGEFASSPRCGPGGEAATLGRGNGKEAPMGARLLPRRAWAVLAVGLALGVGACGQANLDKAGGAVSKPTVLTLADGEFDTSNAQPFASAVSRLSHGTLQIKIEGDWRASAPNHERDL